MDCGIREIRGIFEISTRERNKEVSEHSPLSTDSPGFQKCPKNCENGRYGVTRHASSDIQAVGSGAAWQDLAAGMCVLEASGRRLLVLELKLEAGCLT